jgi:hypothetical protein
MFSMSTFSMAYTYVNFYLQVHGVSFSSDPAWEHRSMSSAMKLAPIDFAYSVISTLEVSHANTTFLNYIHLFIVFDRRCCGCMENVGALARVMAMLWPNFAMDSFAW